jgi:Na+-driven multidrug efflux pump
MIETLDLSYANGDMDAMCSGLVAYVGRRLQARNYEQIAATVQALYWFNRVAYTEIMRTYGPHIINVMNSEPAPASTI